MKYFLALVVIVLISFSSTVALAQWYDSKDTQPTVARLQQVITDLNNELVACQQSNQTQAASDVEQTGPYTYDVGTGVWLDSFYAPVVYPWFIYGGVRYNRGFGRGYGIVHSPGFGRGHSIGHSTGHPTGHPTGRSSGSSHPTGHSQGHR